MFFIASLVALVVILFTLLLVVLSIRNDLQGRVEYLEEKLAKLQRKKPKPTKAAHSEIEQWAQTIDWNEISRAMHASRAQRTRGEGDERAE